MNFSSLSTHVISSSSSVPALLPLLLLQLQLPAKRSNELRLLSGRLTKMKSADLHELVARLSSYIVFSPRDKVMPKLPNSVTIVEPRSSPSATRADGHWNKFEMRTALCLYLKLTIVELEARSHLTPSSQFRNWPRAGFPIQLSAFYQPRFVGKTPNESWTRLCQSSKMHKATIPPQKQVTI